MAKNRSGKKGIDAQVIGAGLLTLTAIASLVMLVVFLTRGPGGSANDPTAGEIESPNMDNLLTNAGEPRVLKGEGLQIQVTDKDDPTRVVAEMNFGKLDPLANRRYEASRTRTWIYLESGFVLITAPRAVLTMPDGKRPESGRLMGGVEMRVYDPPRGGGRPDPRFAEPKLIAKTDRFDFDLTLGEVSAPGRLTVHTDRVDFAGSDMEAIINESHRRIESVSVRVGESLVYRPAKGDESDEIEIARRGDSLSERGEAIQPGVSREVDAPGIPTDVGQGLADESASPVSPDRRGPLRQHYRVVFTDAVRVVQGLREIRGDRLDVWARLVDNKLPSDALGRERREALLPRGGGRARTTLPGILASAAIAAFGQEAQATRLGGFGVVLHQPAIDAAGVDEAGEMENEADGLALLERDETVVLQWDGPMTVEFLRGPSPEELKAQNHLAVRFTAPETGTVAFEDHESGASGICGELFYKATVRQLTLAGLGPHAVRLVRPGAGMLEAGRVEVDLYTGEASIPGAGIAYALGDEQDRPDPGEPRRVSWTERADLQLVLQEEKLTGDILWAKMLGRVEALDGDARLGGEVMDATFFERSEDRDPTLRHLQVVGPVTGGDGRGATMLGDRLSIDFAASDTGRSDPRTVSIEGAAEVRRDASTLEANIIDARLERNEDNKLVVAFVSARDDVRYSDTESAILAVCDRLRADASLKIANLEGESVVLRQGSDEITGTQVHLNGTDRIVEVFSAGTFSRYREDGEGPPIATAVWSKQMLFDDRQGTLDCYGDAFATWRPDEFAIDEVTAERLHIELTPYREPSEGSGEALGVRVDRDKREVIRVRAIGASQLEEGGALAVIQSLHESPIEPAEGEERAIETLLRLEGPEIIANNQIGQLRVDHPGRLVVADFRDGKPDEAGDSIGEDGETELSGGENADEIDGDVELAEGEPDESDERQIAIDDPGSMRGSALFEWDDSLVVDRNANTITMDGRVRMTHVRLGDELVTRLLCEHLVAGFEEPEADSDRQGTELGGGRLRSVLASGEVYARSGRQELMGDELLYDARRSTLEAQAGEGSRVTYVDARTGTPSSARRIFWDLKTDRIEIREPGTLVLPR